MWVFLLYAITCAFFFYICLSIFLTLRKRWVWNCLDWGICFGFLGALSNSIVIFFNGGLMPVACTDMYCVQLTQAHPLYTQMSDSTRLAFLGDIIALDLSIIGLERCLASVGDVSIALGEIILLFYVIRALACKIDINKKSSAW